MSRVTRYPGRDLIALAGASLVSLGLMALPVDGLVKALLLVPLVLFIPGYALAAAMFPAATLGRGERLVYAFSLSVGAAALGGLTWQLAFGLGRFGWAAILTAVTLASCVVAHRRRAALQPGRLSTSPRLTGLGAATVVGLLAAVALAVFAVRTAIDGLQDQRAESNFTALWIVPSEDGAGSRIEVGVANHQSAIHRYRLVVTGAGRTLREWEGRLGARAQLELGVEPARIPAGARLVVSLYRDGALYRRAKLQTEVGT